MHDGHRQDFLPTSKSLKMIGRIKSCDGRFPFHEVGMMNLTSFLEAKAQVLFGRVQGESPISVIYNDSQPLFETV
jgi:hypothetical protein